MMPPAGAVILYYLLIFILIINIIVYIITYDKMFYKLGGRRPPNCDGPLALEIKETEQNYNKESRERRAPPRGFLIFE